MNLSLLVGYEKNWKVKFSQFVSDVKKPMKMCYVEPKKRHACQESNSTTFFNGTGKNRQFK